MSHTGNNRAELKKRIQEIDASIEGKRKELNELRKQEYDAMLEETASLIGKCFKEEVDYGACTVAHYVMITGYPKLSANTDGVGFNPFQFPSIQFYISNRDYPFSFEDDCHSEDVFFFDMIFTGRLPKGYRFGAVPSDMANLVEISADEFNMAMNLRYAQFKGKIFEVQCNT